MRVKLTEARIKSPIIQMVTTGNIQGQQTSITNSYSDYKKTDFGFYAVHSWNRYGSVKFKKHHN